MVARWDRHPAKQVVDPQVVRLFAVQVGIPALIIVDLAEDGELIGLCGELIVDLFQQVIDQPDGSRAYPATGWKGMREAYFCWMITVSRTLTLSSACISSSPFFT